VDARPWLVAVARALRDVGLEVVLIGNAAAALRGAPVTTVDLDFLFRRTPRNLRKLRALADALGAAVLRPYYPASDLFRLVRDDDGLQVDFMGTVHGLRSFEGVRDRADALDFDGVPLLVARLSDVIRSKRAARRPRDLAVLPLLEQVLDAEEARRTPPTPRPPATARGARRPRQGR
jgi:predicted nucleotidyltransferase